MVILLGEKLEQIREGKKGVFEEVFEELIEMMGDVFVANNIKG